MFKEQMNKFKDLILKKIEENKGEGKTNKRKIENLVVFLIILIVTLIIINSILKSDKVDTKDEQSPYKVLAEKEEKQSEVESTELETKLEKILETMVGVGKVKVLVTYTNSREITPMYNENTTTSNTSENDSAGGTRTIEETGTNKQVVFTEENGANVPATQTIINPKVEGVIVTAEGANDANVKSDIVSAVTAVTGAQAHKVQVFSMN